MDATAPPKRPKLVWAIFLFYVFSVGYTALSFYLILSGKISITPEQASYFRNLSALDWTIIGANATLNLAGAIALFCLRKLAFALFVASLGISILHTIVQAFTTSVASVLGGSGAIGLAIGYGIAIAVCAYVWQLKTRGILS